MKPDFAIRDLVPHADDMLLIDAVEGETASPCDEALAIIASASMAGAFGTA